MSTPLEGGPVKIQSAVIFFFSFLGSRASNQQKMCYFPHNCLLWIWAFSLWGKDAFRWHCRHVRRKFSLKVKGGELFQLRLLWLSSSGLFFYWCYHEESFFGLLLIPNRSLRKSNDCVRVIQPGLTYQTSGHQTFGQHTSGHIEPLLSTSGHASLI